MVNRYEVAQEKQGLKVNQAVILLEPTLALVTTVQATIRREWERVSGEDTLTVYEEVCDHVGEVYIIQQITPNGVELMAGFPFFVPYWVLLPLEGIPFSKIYKMNYKRRRVRVRL